MNKATNKRSAETQDKQRNYIVTKTVRISESQTKKADKETRKDNKTKVTKRHSQRKEKRRKKNT